MGREMTWGDRREAEDLAEQVMEALGPDDGEDDALRRILGACSSDTIVMAACERAIEIKRLKVEVNRLERAIMFPLEH
jgi:hypothetical protein